jgi:hypothetical protein
MMTDATMFVEIIPNISRSIGVALVNPDSSEFPAAGRRRSLWSTTQLLP